MDAQREGLEALEWLIERVDKNMDGAEVAQSLVGSFRSLRSVYEMNKADLIMNPGMTRAVSEAIDLVDELYRYTRRDAFGPKPYLRRLDRAGEYLSVILCGMHVEYCYMLCLDARGRLLGCPLIQKGTVDRSAVYMRDIALTALRSKAEYAVLGHNHPGGSDEPSPADISVTYQAMDALRVVRAVLLDHIIISDGAVVSLRKQGTPTERIWLKQRADDKLLKRWFDPEEPKYIRR